MSVKNQRSRLHAFPIASVIRKEDIPRKKMPAAQAGVQK
jgi:hypothetical protein